MLDLEDFRELAALAGERRIRLIQGGDPRLEPREAEALLLLVDDLAARGFDVLSGLVAVANDPVRFAPRFATGDLSRVVTVEPDRPEEGLGGARSVAPLPSLSLSRKSVSRVSRPLDGSAEAGS